MKVTDKPFGFEVAWDCGTANAYNGSAFQDLVNGVVNQMLVFGDPHFLKKGWHPTNLKPYKRGEWDSRMVIETVFSRRVGSFEAPTLLRCLLPDKNGVSLFFVCNTVFNLDDTIRVERIESMP